MDFEGVRKARKEDMEEYHTHGCIPKYWLRSASESRDSPIGSRWVDVNKGDGDNPEYRSRLVAKDITHVGDGGEDLFAATPPLEAKKCCSH